MARKQKHAAHENHERWLVSYADFITLLFAFFVVMFASSQADKGKAQQMAESVTRALEEGKVTSAIMGILGGAADQNGKGNATVKRPAAAKAAEKPAEAIAELQPSLELLSKDLKPEIDAGRLQIKMQGRGLVVSLMEAAFFPPGEDTIEPKVYPSLEKIAEAIRKVPNRVRFEGHTDPLPIHNGRFPSNWELSAGRANAMLHLFAGRFGLPEARMAVAGYADTAPIAPNSTEDGRAHNRRVDVVILNKMGMEIEPPAEEAAATPPAASSPHHGRP